MKESIKQEVLQRMLPLLDNAQAKALEQTLETVLCKYMEGKPDENEISSQELLQKFLEAKRIEGCSEKTLTYYQNTINRMLTETGKEVTHIMTEDLRSYLTDYQKPHTRLTIGGVESRVREIGKRLDIEKVHPHKFRRTLATKAIDKGMPIEQLQQLLGHKRIDTTLQYAMVKQSNVKLAHKKYIG